MPYFKIILEKPEPERHLLELHCFDPVTEGLLLDHDLSLAIGPFCGF
jgi:hypothetical protein